MNRDTHPRVAVIGLDAADLDYISAHRSYLPQLNRMLDCGITHRLESTAGVLAGSVWPTFYTGALPGVHGVYHNLQWDQEAMRLRRVSADWLDYAPFWLELERSGRRVTVLDPPMSYAPRVGLGIEVLNWGAHDQLGDFACNRKDLGREILGLFGRHPMGNEVPVDKTRRQRRRIQEQLVRGARLKGELSVWLLRRERWDFFLTVFGETHRGGHILWPDPDADVDPSALLDVYRAVDEAIGSIIKALPPNTIIMVMALHGMGANDSQEHFMAPVLERINAHWRGAGIEIRNQRSVLRWMRDRLPAGLQQFVAGAVPAAVRDFVVNGSLAGGRDWSHTPACPLHADLNGYVRLNIANREAKGLLGRDDGTLDGYLEWFRNCMHEFRDTGSGRSLVEEILSASAVFPGRRVDRLPDLIVRWNPQLPVTAITSTQLGTVLARRATGRGGNHRSVGFCVIDGAAAAHRCDAPRHIKDLPFTIRQLLALGDNSGRDSPDALR